MIPFARISKYGNKVELPTVKKFDSIGMGRNSNGGGNWLGAILATNGNLYGLGVTKEVSFGIQPKNGSGIELIMTGVKNFWLLSNGIVVLTDNDQYMFCGAYANGIFTNSSPNIGPYRAPSFINVSSYFTNVGEVVDMVFCGGYDKGPAANTNPTYNSKYNCTLVAMNTLGEVWYMGISQGLINNSSPSFYYTAFTKDNQLTKKAVALRCTIDMGHNGTYYTGNRPVLYAKLEDGSLVGKGYNIRYGIATPASANQVFTTWQTIVTVGQEFDFSASNEGMLYSSNSSLYRCGSGGGFSYYDGSRFYYYTNYCVGMSVSGPDNVNSVSGGFKILTTAIKDGGTINLPTTSMTKIRMNFCGTVIFDKGGTSIYKAHGTYSDYFPSPSWTTGTVPNFTYEDIGINIRDAMFVGGTLGFSTYGLLVISTEGKVYWRGAYNGVTYSTLTEIPLVGG